MNQDANFETPQKEKQITNSILKKDNNKSTNKKKSQVSIQEINDKISPTNAQFNKMRIGGQFGSDLQKQNEKIPSIQSLHGLEEDQDDNINNQKIQFQDVLKKFSNLKCPTHKIRICDHICNLKNCTFSKSIYCSKCLLEDESHVKQHKENFQSLEDYLPEQINKLAGQHLVKKLENLCIYKNEMLSYTNKKCDNLIKRINNDFQEILNTVTAYCEQMKCSLVDQVKKFQKQKGQEFQEISKNIDKYIRINDQQRARIYQEFEEIINNNFDFSEIVKMKGFSAKFDSEIFADQQKEELTRIEYDLKNNQYYNKADIENIKIQIEELLQNPYEKNSLINFSPLLPKPNLQEKKVESMIQNNDLFSIIEKQSTHPSLANIATLNTQLKHPINSICYININYQNKNSKQKDLNNLNESQNNYFNQNNIKFATASSDPQNSIRLWGYTNNFTLYELGSKAGKGKFTVNTENHIALNLHFQSDQNLLFAAMSNSQIYVYDLSNMEDMVEKIANFVGHNKPIRCLSIQIPLILSIGHDQMLNIYQTSNIYNQAQNKNIEPITNLELDSDYRVVHHQQHIIALGNNTGKIKIVHITNQDGQNYTAKSQFDNESDFNIQNSQDSISSQENLNKNEQQEKLELSLKQVKELQISSAKITALQISLNLKELYIGTASGSFAIIDLKKFQTIFKTVLNKGQIFGINLFQSMNQVFYLSVVGWDNQINLIDKKNNCIVSDTKLKLKYQEKKHFNLQGLRICQDPFNKNFYGIVTGNDDSSIEIIQYSFK
ncbi:WD40-repeat-containing domain [Pseudocohnilembus persalinus]|uniref:WD40-repeat-containing domain n=1 Tax=Pseudocohnilembus persalinus TaxID=266149 RepID=A0A0V0QTY6_PSEPJ|nr:WD40-repeat-containing domain [Pseudocohnilembus persalinus]|eukprot:KRX05659.1 WD40-repeat-containing domain [Pseudocohnilembus persalinus]